MLLHCRCSPDLRRLTCSLGLSLSLPTALALCILVGPNLGLQDLGLQDSFPAGECRQQAGAACEDAGLGQSIPAAARSDTDAIHIHVVWLQYRYYMAYRRRSERSRRTFQSAAQSRGRQKALAQFHDDYRCVYQEVTPAARRRAHLPDPEGSAFNSQEF